VAAVQRPLLLKRVTGNEELYGVLKAAVGAVRHLHDGLPCMHPMRCHPQIRYALHQDAFAVQRQCQNLKLPRPTKREACMSDTCMGQECMRQSCVKFFGSEGSMHALISPPKESIRKHLVL
jgi:hypothetical protein